MNASLPPLLRQPEGKQLEFKRDLSSPRNVLKTLVAFANSAGGRRVIGVDDARQVAEEERIRNPVIARMFRELHLVEQWGSGIKRIFSEAAAQGLPEPRVTEIATSVRLSVFLSTQHQTGATSAQEIPLAHTNAQVNAQVSEQVIGLLQHCAAQPRNKQELLAALGLSNAYLNYKRHIVPLLEQNLIAMTIPDKPQSRLQRYRLTAQGQALLAALRSKENPTP